MRRRHRRVHSRTQLTPPLPLLGKPMPDAEVYLLDDGLNPVPVGVVGESTTPATKLSAATGVARV